MLHSVENNLNITLIIFQINLKYIYLAKNMY